MFENVCTETERIILNITFVTKIHCGWLSQPKSRLSKVFNTSKHLFFFSDKEIKYASHSCSYNFVFSPNPLSYLALLHPATILTKTFGKNELFSFYFKT